MSAFSKPEVMFFDVIELSITDFTNVQDHQGGYATNLPCP